MLRLFQPDKEKLQDEYQQRIESNSNHDNHEEITIMEKKLKPKKQG
jgi:hypothetical protein